MGQEIMYPDGTFLLSTALTLQQINTLLQKQTLGMLGLTQAANNSAVRIEYPAEGAPFQQRTDDVTYIRCFTKEGSYDKIRDRYNWKTFGEGYSQGPFSQQPYGGKVDPTTLAEQWSYTRTWSIRWCLYGPNSTDKARAIKSGLYQDYFTDILAKSNLFPVSDFPDPIRAPELIDAQWWERVDFEVEMYEFVTELIARQTVRSVEVKVSVPVAQFADFTVTDGSPPSEE